MKTLVWVTTAAALLATTSVADAYTRHHRHHHGYAQSHWGFGMRPGYGYGRNDCWLNEGPGRWTRCDSGMTGGR